VSSSQSSNQGRRLDDLQIPRGDTVASFETYRQAQEAVDLLAQSDFPVKSISIIGEGLKSVERVTGKLSYGRAAGAGALSGAWLGLFFGLLLVIVNPASSLLFVGAAVLIGAAFGMLFMVVSYSLNRRRRDFTSVMQVLATSYSVVAPPDIANRARNLLEQGGKGGSVSSPAGVPSQQPPANHHPSDPPPYGERIETSPQQGPAPADPQPGTSTGDERDR